MNSDDREAFVPLDPDAPPIRINPPHFAKCGILDPLAVGDQGWIPLASFKDCLKGNDGIAIGNGPSFLPVLSSFLSDYWTIGVNRTLIHFRADFHVCAEDPKDVELWQLIQDEDPLVVFTTSAGYHRRAVRFHGNARAWLTRDAGDWLGGAMSTWYAAALLAYMGCETIGVLGVDLVGHHQFGRDDPAILTEQDRQWKKLRDVIRARNGASDLVNLSEISTLTALPKRNFAAIRTRGSTLAR